MLTWVVTGVSIALLVVLLVGVWILLRISAELRSLRRTARQQLLILSRIHQVVVGTQVLVGSRGWGQVVPEPESACGVPLSPSGQWPSVESLAGTEFPSQEENSV